MGDWYRRERTQRWEVRQILPDWTEGEKYEADSEEHGKDMLHKIADSAPEHRWELVRVVHDEAVFLVRDRRRPAGE